MKAILFLLFPALVFASTPQTLMVDPFLSPYAGAHDLLTVQSNLLKLEEKVFTPNTPLKTQWAGRLTRAAEMLFVVAPINYGTMVTQHEVFGHGFRARSLPNAKVDGYSIGLPPPYGTGGGCTHLSISKDLRLDEAMTLSMGGVEATSILAHEIKMNAVQEGSIDARLSSLYSQSHFDITNYISTSYLLLDYQEGNDIQSYLMELNLAFGTLEYLELGEDFELISLKGERQLLKLSFLNFIDPLSIYSIISWWKYVWSGTPNTPLPMLKIGSLQFLPNTRLGLTPYGPEGFLENYLKINDQTIYTYAKYGTYAGHKYYGCGVDYPSIVKIGEISLGARLDGWNQPDVHFPKVYQVEEQTAHILGMRLGFAASLKARYQMNLISAFVEAGYKTRGFLPGTPLTNTPISRLGLEARF